MHITQEDDIFESLKKAATSEQLEKAKVGTVSIAARVEKAFHCRNCGQTTQSKVSVKTTSIACQCRYTAEEVVE